MPAGSDPHCAADARRAKPPRFAYKGGFAVGQPDGEAFFYGRREIIARRDRTVDPRDAKELLLLAFYFCVAALIPASRWDGICRFVACLRIRRHRRKLFATLKRDLAAVAPEKNPEAVS